jgi:hypothetical protein
MVKRYVPAWRPIDDPTWFDLQSDGEQHLGVSRHGTSSAASGPLLIRPFCTRRARSGAARSELATQRNAGN